MDSVTNGDIIGSIMMVIALIINGNAISPKREETYL